MHRRTLLKASLALTSIGLPAFPALADTADGGPKGEPFDFDWLKRKAQTLASGPYQSQVEKLPPSLKNLQPLDYQKIHYKREKSLWWGHKDFDLRAHFFHVGMHFDQPVRMHAVDRDSGQARELHFNPGLFDYDDSGIDPSKLRGRDLGFAGFRLEIDPEADIIQEVASFLGASYFRAIDENKQYGLSARGLAVDTAVPSGEEFPSFTDFWFVTPEPHSERVTVYALLDSPSVTGAYRFDIDVSAFDHDGKNKGVTMQVAMTVFTRKAIKRLGIAPMTSMFLKGTSQTQARDTIHPQIHDSDRLSMWRGNGEWVCRPLFNPPRIQYNAFTDENPRGFGLVQHDHDFDHYRDNVAWYNRRPSLWVEPTNDWGKGEIALLELPTVGETVDNIAAFWIPEQPVEANQQLTYDYKLYWWPLPPVEPTLAQVDKTWTGMGNVPEGWIPGDRSPEQYARRFAVDFVGQPLDGLDPDTEVTADVQVSRGKLGLVETRRFEPIKGYRAIFDWIPQSPSVEAVSMRLYLRAGDRPLTETWLYQWVPPKPDQRYY